jgi:zinc transporter 2
MEDIPEIQSPLRSKTSIEADKLLFKIPEQQNHKGNFKKLIIVSVMCVMFITGEIVGGILSHSISVISDAMHLITDLIGFILSFVFLYYSSRHAS